jgi:transcriptional regulator with XRE-family HTH domain
MMSRPRIDLGLEPSSVTLNEPVAARIGQALAKARVASALSVNTVADRLLLSRSQVQALEAVDTSVFYNVKFHVAALRKYANLLGVRTDAIDDVLVEPTDGDTGAQGDSRPAFMVGRVAAAVRRLFGAVCAPGHRRSLSVRAARAAKGNR